MSNVSKGHDYEREVKKKWEEWGYTVTRAASSNGTFDLVATKIERTNTKKTYYVCLMQQKIRKRRVKK